MANPTGSPSTQSARAVDVSEPGSYEVNIARPAAGTPLGIKVDGDNEVLKIAAGGAVAADGRLRVGDKILSVSGTPLGAITFADALQQLYASDQEVFRFQVTHPAHGGSTSEKLAAAVLQKKAQQHEKALAADRHKASKKREALAARESAEQSVAAAAATALRAALRKESVYKMPDLEDLLLKLEARANGGSLSSAGSGVGGNTPATKATPRKHSRAASAPRGLRAAPREVEAGPTTATATSAAVVADTLTTARGGSAIFVHFIPPPLRAEGKRDLPWIVHTTDGSGCQEARHVAFHSISGFSSFEGAPPEVAEGTACACNIANHHLRGFGKVRWEAQCHAVVEDDGSVLAMADGRTYMDKARRLEREVKELQQRLAFVAG